MTAEQIREQAYTEVRLEIEQMIAELPATERQRILSEIGQPFDSATVTCKREARLVAVEKPTLAGIKSKYDQKKAQADLFQKVVEEVQSKYK